MVISYCDGCGKPHEEFGNLCAECQKKIEEPQEISVEEKILCLSI